MPQFDEHGNVLYRCFTCKDSGWVHPRKEDGRPDYAHATPCKCRGEFKPPQMDIQQSEAEYQATTRKRGKGRR